ncbi:MAG TPA: penicillin-binding transpeptidase domain-containing protein [Chthoniobacteraceae bacterium]|nr:penicillin-binding transpeptidase domain-containing protein [Chthoniobacteraceae bacterium]
MFSHLLILAALALPLPDTSFKEVFSGDEPAALVIVESATGQKQHYHPALCAEKLPPCSTFKIWNAAIGFETGVVKKPDEPFYQWDGKKRKIEDWNRDLTLKEAFAVSCVPAFQELARKIGPVRMNGWLEKLDYGDRNTASGNDVFWLPAPGRKPLLISPDEQAALLVRLVNGDLPFSRHTLAALKETMKVRETKNGTLYGKTGTGPIDEKRNIAWFVGYVESGRKTFAFACALKSETLMGPDVRARVIDLLTQNGLL